MQHRSILRQESLGWTLVMDHVTKEMPAVVRMPLSALGESLPPD